VDTELRQLRRVRWGVRFTLALGISASLAANVLHAHHLLIDQIIAGWPPVAVFATIEAIARVPIRRRWLAAIRMAGLGFVAAIAFWVSYWHMASVAASHGENGSKYLLPLSVDGLVLVSSISLVELTSQITATQATARAASAAGVTGTAAATATTPATAVSRTQVSGAEVSGGVPLVVVAARQESRPYVGAPGGTVAATAAADRSGDDLDDAPRAAVAGIRAPHDPHADTAGHDRDGGQQASGHGTDTNAAGTADRHDAGLDEPQPAAADDQRRHAPAAAGAGTTGAAATRPSTGDVPPANTADAIAYWRAKDPTMSVRELCAKVGRSERTVRRILDGLPLADQQPADSQADPGGHRSGANGAAVPTLAGTVTSG